MFHLDDGGIAYDRRPTKPGARQVNREEIDAAIKAGDIVFMVDYGHEKD